ncbi:MAG: hypothetical protein U5R31_14310 [Acidimicrobiia bacterium]|nr:hypothetical protein [Acidimicrobiia bacterium]
MEFANDGAVVLAAGLANFQITTTTDARTSYGFALGAAPVQVDGTMEGQTELTVRAGDETTEVREGTWQAELAPDGSLRGSIDVPGGERYRFVTAADPTAADLIADLRADD